MAPSAGATGAVQLSQMLKSAAIMNMAYFRYCTAKDITAAPKVISEPSHMNNQASDGHHTVQNSCFDDDGTPCKVHPQCLNGLDPGGNPCECINGTCPENERDHNVALDPTHAQSGDPHSQEQLPTLLTQVPTTTEGAQAAKLRIDKAEPRNRSDGPPTDRGGTSNSGVAKTPNEAPPIDPGSGGGTSSSSSAKVEKKHTRAIEMLGMTSQVRALKKKMCTEVCGEFFQSSDQPEPPLSETNVVHVPLTRDNLVALWVLGVLSCLGCIYLWKLFTQQSCKCKLCRGGFDLVESLGSGGYGEVYVVSKSPDKQLFVAKKIRVRNITEAEDYSQEAKDLVGLRHKHIVSYEEDFVHTELPFRYSGGSLTRAGHGLESTIYYFIVMEYCEHGDLKQKIEFEYESLCEKQVLKWFFQTCQAVQYLHSKKVIHRDIKSQNVFLTAYQDVRLGDFGLCRHMPKESKCGISYTHAGTDCYMAPEMLSSTRYGMPADVWSLGAVLYEMCSGQFMWELENGTILGAAVMQDRKFASDLIDNNIAQEKGMITPETRALMKKMLSYEPNRRPTVTEVIRKKVFKRGFNAYTLKFGDCLEKSEKDSKDSDDSSEDGSSDDDEEERQDSKEVEEEELDETAASGDAERNDGLIARGADKVDKLLGWLFTKDEETTGTSTTPSQNLDQPISDTEECMTPNVESELDDMADDLNDDEDQDEADDPDLDDESPSAKPNKGKSKKKKGLAKRAAKRFKPARAKGSPKA